MTPKLASDLQITTKSIAKLRTPNTDIVLIPAYTDDDKFGYFIARELLCLGVETGFDRFMYEEIAFSADYEHAITLFKQHTANKA